MIKLLLKTLILDFFKKTEWTLYLIQVNVFLLVTYRVQKA